MKKNKLFLIRIIFSCDNNVNGFYGADQNYR